MSLNLPISNTETTEVRAPRGTGQILFKLTFVRTEFLYDCVGECSSKWQSFNFVYLILGDSFVCYVDQVSLYVDNC